MWTLNPVPIHTHNRDLRFAPPWPATARLKYFHVHGPFVYVNCRQEARVWRRMRVMMMSTSSSLICRMPQCFFLLASQGTINHWDPIHFLHSWPLHFVRTVFDLSGCLTKAIAFDRNQQLDVSQSRASQHRNWELLTVGNFEVVEVKLEVFPLAHT